MTDAALDRFHPATRAWFAASFDQPTHAQYGAWASITAGHHALVVAPTGSGKTLAAFLWALDRLHSRPLTEKHAAGVRVLYISPLKALAVDVERNLRAPLAGIRAQAERLGLTLPAVSVAVRTGDTPADERRRFGRHPADILITTPESLYLLLTSRARETLHLVDTIIIDEIHALTATKRGAHLALSLERLEWFLPQPPQRIGLSATVRPHATVARFLGGGRPVDIVDAHDPKPLEITIEVPVDDLTALGQPVAEIPTGNAAAEPRRNSIWPHVEARLLELIQAHRSTIVFVNARRLAERLCARLNELAETELVRAHHGSVSREQRNQIEDALKRGQLRAVVATSSLELGIDMGAVDLVIQVEAPITVASGLQRIGRAGHQVGAVSRGIVFPKFRGDLLESAVVVDRMRAGAIEALQMPRNPLDVLAQQVVAMVAMDDWSVDDLAALTQRAAPFAELPRSALEAVLDMLAGRYPADAFGGLRPRLNWDRMANQLSARRGAGLVALTSGGTIPDRGLFGVYLAGDKRTRVGELDEEMVYESRAGEVFLLGASSWRIEEITADRVIVAPAPGAAGKMPFWRGDALGRPIELGRALGAFVRTFAGLDAEQREARLRAGGCDERAARNLSRYLDEQRSATRVVPDDQTIVVERFRDAVGDWRLCIHSFFGARVHAPWALTLAPKLRAQLGVDVQVIYSNDGIVVRVPEGDEAPTLEALFPDPDEVEDLLVAELGGSALFASRFRECAGRALLLPKHRAGARTPLWQQRQKAATLLQIASQHASFPIVLETYRECLQDVFDLPALIELLRLIRSRSVRVVDVETDIPSPFATSLQMSYVSAFLYEGDAPLAERRAQALALDRSVLAELMGREELRDLLDAGALADIELELQHLTTDRRARDADDLHDRLRLLGDLSEAELAARAGPDIVPAAALAQLARQHRAVQVRVAGEQRWIAIEDASRYRDALGTNLPIGLPVTFLDPVDDPLGDIVGRYARTHGPFTVDDVAARLGLGRAVVLATLRRLASAGTVTEGEFRPAGSGTEWIDLEVLRRVRRRSLAALRKEIEPVAHDTLARFSVAWHDLDRSGGRLSGAEALWRVIEQLQGAAIPASALERQVLRARIPDYSPALLDNLGASGELVWAGAGALGTNDGWVVLATAERAPLLLPEPQPSTLGALAARVFDVLQTCGALFFRQLSDRLDGPNDTELMLAVWELVWAGRITNDTLAPLRALLQHRPLRATSDAALRRPRPLARSGPPAVAGRWSLLPTTLAEPTRRKHAWGEQLLARYGVLTRGAVVGERVSGGFAAVYPVLTALEDRGRCRRGYFVEGLGGAQFALPGAVDRLRALSETAQPAVVLAATDPANPYGAALPWPDRPGVDAAHRAGRKAGAVVVLVAGQLVLYVERGGRSLLTYSQQAGQLQDAVAALAQATRSRLVGKLEVERVNGLGVHDTALAVMLGEVGFQATYKGLQLRA